MTEATPTDVITRLNAALEGRYRIERELGAGGMATVYLAQDLKHDRQVAIKVLRPELAAVIGADRFLAEIKTTANLQHPHILPLFDSGESDGFLYYVMPFIDGESLREQLDREKQLGVEEAVRIAKDVADALEYAHGQGVIHRDIKPANILLHRGRPVVADFGIAVAISAAGGGRMTETGLSLGTPHYMSPEQASADRDLSARSDVYSLGCVLYEMIAGQPPHTGPSAQSVLVRIMTEAPRNLTEVRHTVPPHVASVVAKAVEKLPADRFESAQAFIDALDDENFTYTARPVSRSQAAAPLPAAARSAPRSRWATWLPWGIAGIAVVAALARGGSDAGPELLPSVRTTLDLGDVQFSEWQVMEIAISADGSRFAAIAEEGGAGRLYFRTGEDLEFRPVPGAEGRLSSASFSPDGEWIAFSMDERLFKASLLGGRPTELVRDDDLGVRLVDWGAEGWVFFWASSPEGLGLYRVPDTGGAVERLVGAPDWETFVPKALPDGSGVLFTDRTQGIAIHDIERDSTWVLTDLGVDGFYSPSGHLLFVDDGGGLWAAPFDLDRKVLTGDAKPVLQGVMTSFVYGRYALSRTGTLVYTSGPSAGGQAGRELVVVGLDGSRTPLDLPPRPLADIRWSPDSRTVFFAGRPTGDLSAGDYDIYSYDTELENAPRRLTNSGNNSDPVPSPDGRRIVFSSIREGTQDWDVFVRNLDDDTPPRLVLSLPGTEWVTDWIEDDLLAIESGDPSGIFLLRLEGDSAAVQPYYTPDADVDDLAVAPAGDLAAYASDESGQDEIYIRAFPDPRAETIVSEGGGRWPRWSPDGGTLYYQDLAGERLFAAEIARNPTAVVVSRRVVFEGQPAFGDLHPAGDRLIQGQAPTTPDEPGAEGEPIRHIVIHNWFTDLHRLFQDGR